MIESCLYQKGRAHILSISIIRCEGLGGDISIVTAHVVSSNFLIFSVSSEYVLVTESYDRSWR